MAEKAGRTTTDNRTESRADTRDKLIQVAIRLFAQEGFHGVSMRNINSAAGTRNSSAVHYHFGNKLGIIEAVMEKLNQQLRPVFDEMADALEQRAAPGKLTPEDVAMALQLPFWVLYCSAPDGRHAVRLCARLMLEADSDLKALYNRYLQQPMTRIMAAMTSLQPHKNPHHLRFQLVHCLMATIAGMATLELLDDTPLGDVRFAHNGEMMMVYVVHLARGLGCDNVTADSFDMTFWSRFGHYLTLVPEA